MMRLTSPVLKAAEHAYAHMDKQIARLTRRSESQPDESPSTSGSGSRSDPRELAQPD